ncbi:MAG: hypothetical protein U9Q07_01765 [Planctomycetota bacterium]|nr:hypothetical protein [Planctomycetota bacterium]
MGRENEYYMRQTRIIADIVRLLNGVEPVEALGLLAMAENIMREEAEGVRVTTPNGDHATVVYETYNNLRGSK